MNFKIPFSLIHFRPSLLQKPKLEIEKPVLIIIFMNAIFGLFLKTFNQFQGGNYDLWKKKYVEVG